MIELQIKLDQPRKSYTSNDKVTGKAFVNANRDTTLTSIKLSCRGIAYINSQQAGGASIDLVYWKEDKILLTLDKGAKLTAGLHQYEFSFKLPATYFPALPASFAFKRDASGSGIRWLVQLSVQYPKIKMKRSQMVEKPFLFFPEYNPKKFQYAVPFVTHEFQEPFRANTHLSSAKKDSGSLRSKIKSSLLKTSSSSPDKKGVDVHCNVIIAKHGISQAPFSSGINLHLWASEPNLVLLKKVVLTLNATQKLYYAAVTDESKFRYEIARLEPQGGEVLPGNPKEPITLVQLLKMEVDGPFIIPRHLPGTFESKYFGQAYVLQVDLTIQSFYNPTSEKTITFEQPVEVLHVWVSRDEHTVPTATFLQSLEAQLGLENYNPNEDDGLPAYSNLESPPYFESDITPVSSNASVASPLNLTLRPLTSIEQV